MCSIRFKSGLHAGIFLRLNTAVRSKSISNSCSTYRGISIPNRNESINERKRVNSKFLKEIHSYNIDCFI